MKHSAGLLLYRRAGGATEQDAAGRLEVLLGHMGGPFFTRRDAGAWTLPKGEYEPPERAWDAARREFTEELGLAPPDGEPVPLGEVRQSGGKVVTAWGVAADLDPEAVVPGTFTIEWPRGSGRMTAFPELDRVAWFHLAEAGRLIVSAQSVFLDRLAAHVGSSGPR